MKLKSWNTVAIALAGVTTAGTALAETYTIDPFHTYPYFEISHLGFSTQRGRFNQTKGTIDIDLEKKTGAVDLTINAESIDTGMKKRDDHLRSPDFLNVAEFPEITFKSKKVTFDGDDKAKVDGDITIMGVTKPITLDVTHIKCGLHPMDPNKKKKVCGFNAVAELKRSDFGVSYGLPGIGDDMKLWIQAEGVKE